MRTAFVTSVLAATLIAGTFPAAAQGRSPDEPAATHGRRPASTVIDRYWDFCEDTAGALDLRRAEVYDDSDAGEYVFVAYTCQPFQDEVLADGGKIVWAIDEIGGTDEFTEFLVELSWDEQNQRPEISVTSTPSEDPDTWEEQYTAPASRFDNGYDIGATLPWWTLDFMEEFELVIAAEDGDGQTDDLPEVYEDVLAFPFGCEAVVLDRQGSHPVERAPARRPERDATILTAPEDLDVVTAGLARLGLDVEQTTRAIGAITLTNISDAALARLQALPEIRHIERPGMRHRLTTSPDDPWYADQWALEAVGAPDAWDVRTGSETQVAVIDDGIDATRPDLVGRVSDGRDTLAGRRIAAGANSDRGGHGTAVSGIIAATGDNGEELVGVDWGATIVPYRVADAAGCIPDQAVADAIIDAADRGVEVINMSIGGPGVTAVLSEAVRYAADAGVIQIAAAGNEADDGSAPSYPAAFREVIAVGASTRDDRLAEYSNRGDYLHLVAPGGDGSGTAAGDVSVLAERDDRAAWSGTSFSAPLVAGAVSLYLGEYPQATADDVGIALAGSAVDLGDPGWDPSFGYGRLDLPNLLATSPNDLPEIEDGPSGTPPRRDRALDGDPATTERLETSDSMTAAVALSRARFADDGAIHAVLARRDVFPDALAGAALTADGPMLFTESNRLASTTREELQRVLPDGATVYLLGGTAALDKGVEEAVGSLGFRVQRLWGQSRIETALAIADEVRRLRPREQRVALARAFGPPGDETAAWADSVSGGAWAAADGVPVLLTHTDVLDQRVADWLEADQPTLTVLLGGTAALSTTVEDAVPQSQRVSGPGRAETAAAVATRLWGVDPSGERSLLVLNGRHPNSWAFGLAAAGVAADLRTPIVYTDGDRVPDVTLEYVGACDEPLVDLLLLGDELLITTAVADRLDAVDGRACEPSP